MLLVKTSKKCINGFTEAIAYEALKVIIGWFEWAWIGLARGLDKAFVHVN